CTTLPIRWCACCLRERSNPRRPQQAFSKLYQHFRVRGHPCGLQDTLSTLRPSCSPRVPPRPRHGRKTRYGWVASPYPTGTFTLQETPSFSWRENAGRQARLEAGAERSKAEAVRRRLDALVRCCAGSEARAYGQSRGVMPFSCAYLAAEASTRGRTSA